TPTRRAVCGPRASVLAGLYRPRALTRVGRAGGQGRVGLVHPAGLEPACPRATPFEGVVYPGSTTDACSPRLLVKGADCAGVCLAVLAWLCPGLSRFWKARLPAGMIRAHAGRLIKLCAPCCREGASGYLLVIA